MLAKQSTCKTYIWIEAKVVFVFLSGYVFQLYLNPGACPDRRVWLVDSFGGQLFVNLLLGKNDCSGSPVSWTPGFVKERLLCRPLFRDTKSFYHLSCPTE